MYRIFSTFDADIDDSRVDSGPFPQPLEFGEVYAEYTASCWVAAVAWSPTGQSVAFASKYRLLWHVRYSFHAAFRLISFPLSSVSFHFFLFFSITFNDIISSNRS